eukprot:IDg12258t1
MPGMLDYVSIPLSPESGKILWDSIFRSMRGSSIYMSLALLEVERRMRRSHAFTYVSMAFLCDGRIPVDTRDRVLDRVIRQIAASISGDSHLQVL